MIPPSTYQVGKCKLCNSDLSNYSVGLIARRSKRSDGRPAPSLYYYHAWCESCNVKYTNNSDRETHDWNCSSIRLDDLLKEMSKAEINQIKSKLGLENTNEHGDVSKRLWKEFFSMKQEGDQFYEFKTNNMDYPYKGIAIKRGDHIIADNWYSIN